VNVDESYSELGLHPGCSDAEIKSAWRRLAARWHPDRNTSPQALRKIQRINRALEEIRRARDSAHAPFAEPDAPVQPAPAVHEHVVELTLEEALAGCTRTLHGELVDGCADCNATGVEPQPGTCRECGGSGRSRQQLWFAWMASPARCKACHGEGVARHACARCEGSGKAAPVKYRCKVQIPAGSRHGDVLQVALRVQSAAGKRSETLRVRIALQEHPFFALEEDGTVRCELPVDGFAWMANRWIEVPTPGGLQQMRLRRGFLTYRIKAQGWPTAAGERADCIVTVDPQFPEEFGKEQDALVDRLMASNARAPRLAQWRRRVADWQAGLRA
jgi:molecular chaperone DnaJ